MWVWKIRQPSVAAVNYFASVGSSEEISFKGFVGWNWPSSSSTLSNLGPKVWQLMTEDWMPFSHRCSSAFRYNWTAI